LKDPSPKVRAAVVEVLSRTLRLFAWLVAMSGITTACCKARGWSLTPTSPISVTLSAAVVVEHRERPLSNGCSLRNGNAPDTLSVQQVRPDLLVSRCGSKATGTVESVRAFYTDGAARSCGLDKPLVHITFFGECESHDLDDATAICSSIRWYVLETQPSPGSDNSSSEGAGKPQQ
jgi:hypothetical protein